MQQVSYGPLIMSIMLIMSCYTGFFNVRRGWQSLNTGPRFYLRLIRRTGWLWIYASRTTDGRPFKPKKLSVPFLYPRVPAGGLRVMGSLSNYYILTNTLNSTWAIPNIGSMMIMIWWSCGQMLGQSGAKRVELTYSTVNLSRK